MTSYVARKQNESIVVLELWCQMDKGVKGCQTGGKIEGFIAVSAEKASRRRYTRQAESKRVTKIRCRMAIKEHYRYYK